MISHTIIILGACALFGCGVWGTTERQVGLGLEDFYPDHHQAKVWATKRTEALASWSIGINWGALDYDSSETQMKMIKQFEDVVETPHVAQVDTKRLWMADFLIWTTRQCEENFEKSSDAGNCGRDKFHEASQSYCAGTWVENVYGLKEKIFQDPLGSCEPYEGGICRPGTEMHDEDMNDLNLAESGVYCPVVDGWSDDKWQFCMMQWRNSTGFSGGRFILDDDQGSPTSCSGEYNKDEQLRWPLPFSSGPTMFSFDLFSHELTLDMMHETRTVCDEDEELHCWMTGIPFDYWSQYDGIFSVLVHLAGYSTLVGFCIAFLFLFAKLNLEKRHPRCKIFWGTLIGAFLIALTIILSLITVVGLSVLAGVNLTGFSNMSFVLSVGFSVEYSVHIVARWLRAGMEKKDSLERVKHTMSFLMLPTFMSFVSSTIGVACLAFTEFEFNQ